MERADQPVSNASLSAFRVLLGALLAFSSARFLAKGWVDELWLGPEHHLTYWWASWVEPLPGIGMYVVLVVMVASAVCLSVGYRSRIAAGVFLGCFIYTELIDAALYLNHYWFVTLAVGAVIILPVHDRYSIDVRRGDRIEQRWAPTWALRAVRFQVSVVYIFAGIAKLNPDWLGSGEPLHHWMVGFSDLPLIGPVMDEQRFGIALSWAGALFDLTIVGWLLFKPTRRFAYVAVIAFHVATWLLFPLGVFPWVMIAAVTIFFAPEWPEQLIARLRRRRSPASDPEPVEPPKRFALSRSGLAVALVVIALQLAIPLRHYAYDSNVRFSEEGYYLSWRVMLTDKVGSVHFDVTDPATGERWRVESTDVLEEWQALQAASRADLILATAHIVAEDFEGRGIADVEVRADAWVSFNGRRRQRYIDPTVDLAAVSRAPTSRPWILNPET